MPTVLMVMLLRVRELCDHVREAAGCLCGLFYPLGNAIV